MAVQLDANPLLFGDVFFHRDIVGDLSVHLAEGRDDSEFSVVAAVLALVVELAFPNLTSMEGIPQGDIGGLGRFSRIQDSWILAQHFIAAVAGSVEEGCIDVFDARGEVGDDDVRRTLLHGQRKFD